MTFHRRAGNEVTCKYLPSTWSTFSAIFRNFQTYPPPPFPPPDPIPLPRPFTRRGPRLVPWPLSALCFATTRPIFVAFLIGSRSLFLIVAEFKRMGKSTPHISHPPPPPTIDGWFFSPSPHKGGISPRLTAFYSKAFKVNYVERRKSEPHRCGCERALK